MTSFTLHKLACFFNESEGPYFCVRSYTDLTLKCKKKMQHNFQLHSCTAYAVDKRIAFAGSTVLNCKFALP